MTFIFQQLACIIINFLITIITFDIVIIIVVVCAVLTENYNNFFFRSPYTAAVHAAINQLITFVLTDLAKNTFAY